MGKLIQTTGDNDIVCLTVPDDKIGGNWRRIGEWNDNFVMLKRYSPTFESGKTMNRYMESMPRFALNGDKITDEIWYAIAITAEVLMRDLLHWMEKNPSSRYEYFDYHNIMEKNAEYVDGGLFGAKIVNDVMDWQLHLWMSVRVAK